MNDDGDDGYNPNEMKMKASKLAQAVAEAAEDKDTEEVLNEFNFLSNQPGTDSVDGMKSSGASSDDGKGKIETKHNCEYHHNRFPYTVRQDIRVVGVRNVRPL